MQVYTHESFLQCYTWDPAAAPGRIEAILGEIRDEHTLVEARPAEHGNIAAIRFPFARE